MFLTEAERKANNAKEHKKAAEECYAFLKDIRDVGYLPVSLLINAANSLTQADGLRETDPGYNPRTLKIPKEAWKTFTPFEKQVSRILLSLLASSNILIL